ncbi:MAG TPA: type II CAAX endopeptidase family protein [Clostridia bacterium]|nr:type II CAAX endopeptidase family protein [Clostridia bacterium]
MSTPENPFGGSEVPVTSDSRTELPANMEYAGIQERFPVWSLGDVVKLALLAVLAVFFCTLLALSIAAVLPPFRHLTPAQLATDPRVIVPGQGAAYLIVIAYIRRLLTRHYDMEFSEAIHWRWPNLVWPAYLAGGVVLALSIQGLSHLLPIPKQMPIDQFFTTATGAWVMAVFGVAIAPLVEELFFRGLLFPALARRLGLVLGIIVTGALFGFIHASQLGKAWAPVLVLFLVGVALTMVRSMARSVAAAFLVHAGYNLTLFTMMYFASDGFHHLERVVNGS